MVDSYDHLAVDWENALRPAGHKARIEPKFPESLQDNLTASHKRVWETEHDGGRKKCVFSWGSRRVKAEIARASRSDTRSDWSTTSGANFTYQLYLQCPSHAVCALYTRLPP